MGAAQLKFTDGVVGDGLLERALQDPVEASDPKLDYARQQIGQRSRSA